MLYTVFTTKRKREIPMSAQPKFDEMIELFQNGNDFELTAKQYANKTGAEFPKDKNYAEKRSAVAKRANKYGYTIRVIPQRIQFIKDDKNT